MTATASDAHAPATNGAESKVDHSEVAFIFVQEYYTFMNKDPHRLHCFYAKDSAMVHGNEGEVTTPHHGQQAIHSKILELDFQDCKVRVLNVDALSSHNGGIIIQVLGEMSNKSEPSRKFSQTFFLAEQPKGYYDYEPIEESDEGNDYQEEEAVLETEPETVAASEAAVAVAEEPAPVEAAPEEPIVAAAQTEPEPVKEEAPEAAPAPVVATEAATEKKADKKTEKKTGDKKSDKKADKKEDLKEAKKEEDAEKTAMATAIPEAPVDLPAPTPAPAPAEPPKPKTWANLAANNSSQWGAQASTTKGASVTVSQPPSKPVAPAPSSHQAQAQQQQHSQPRTHRESHSIYVKNVTEKMTQEQLRDAFSQFGVVKHLELTAKRNCAFVDFATAEAMQAALKQNVVKVGHETVLAEERRRLGGSGPQSGGSGGRPFHHQNGSNGHVNGHRYDAKQGGPQGGAGRGGRGGSARGGPGDRKPFHRQENKPVPAAAK
ncbi:hypothetical protein BGZ73_000647 [Actinomortierella ambigua]|nr:hypothetical protein BGZ73_000647 [Actinomortierella ambigua]